MAEHTLIYFIQLSLVEYVNILPGDALATDFLKIIINKRYSQQVYRYQKINDMRFYEDWGGFIWEYNSFGEFIKCFIARTLSAIVTFGVILVALYLIGKYC